MLRLLSGFPLGLLMILNLVPVTSFGNGVSGGDDYRILDEQTQRLKKDVLELNKDLFLLEEELLFPSSTQVSVFISIDVGKLFDLDSIQLKIDDQVVSSYLYTRREIDALHRGGVHRIYSGNIKNGEHELVALIVGRGPKGRDYRRGASLMFNKNLGPRFIELKIIDSKQAQRPDFSFKEW